MEQMTLSGMEMPPETITFTPTRSAGLARLDQFGARGGQAYARLRNFDFGPARRGNVSALSPWIRHRLITEDEVLRHTLARQTPAAAEKFIQEVFWRGYFKGWLEQRPSVWRAYQAGVQSGLDAVAVDRDLRQRYRAACDGGSGIDCFDAWARELVDTGYLHNHARMWFASIWIFTLRLPWELGADFFLRHLMDGDPASNTLSWRWVAGLHTKGKSYLARPDNIAKYTDGRFSPQGQLARAAVPLEEPADHPLVPLAQAAPFPAGRFILLITEEDARPEDWLPRAPEAVLGARGAQDRFPLPVGDVAKRFGDGALVDALMRLGAPAGDGAITGDWAGPLIAAAQQAGAQTVVTSHAPVGPVADRLDDLAPRLVAEGLALHRVRRRYDDLTWPHATKGFFGLKKKIPAILTGLGLAQ